MKIKKSIIIVLALLTAVLTQAEEHKNQQYIYINIGGRNSLSYKLKDGTQENQMGSTLNIGYSVFINKHFGLLTGVGFQNFGAISTINKQIINPDIDSEGENFEFRANYKNWKEKQNSLFLDFPIAIQYRQLISSKFQLISSFGAKISLPINSSYKSIGGEIETTGFYNKLNVEYKNLPQHGFSSYNSFNGNISFKTAYIGIADIGMLVSLSKKVNLYMGGYLNYGLNNIRNKSDKQIYQLNGTYNGILNSNQTEKVTTVAMGLKIGVYVELTKKKDCNCNK